MGSKTWRHRLIISLYIVCFLALVSERYSFLIILKCCISFFALLSVAGELGAPDLRRHWSDVAYHVYQWDDGDEHDDMYLGNLLEGKNCTHFRKEESTLNLPFAHVFYSFLFRQLLKIRDKIDANPSVVITSTPFARYFIYNFWNKRLRVLFGTMTTR